MLEHNMIGGHSVAAKSKSPAAARNLIPFPVSPWGKAGAGMVPPTPQHGPRQPTPLARLVPAAPPARGASPPLRIPRYLLGALRQSLKQRRKNGQYQLSCYP